MAEPAPVLGMFKFGARRHMEQFAKGLLYMNTLQHFVDVELHSLRKDSDEGSSFMLQADGAMLEVVLEGAFTPIAKIRGALYYRHPEILSVNVFCMYALRQTPSGVFVDSRNLEFGDTFAVIIKHNRVQ